jgi:hypothetical protein
MKKDDYPASAALRAVFMAHRASGKREIHMAVVEPSWAIILIGVITLGVALTTFLAVVLSGRNKARRAPDRNEFDDLRDEVAELRAEVERLKAGWPSHGLTDIK